MTAPSFTEYVSDGNATCTKDGTKTAQCDNCDKTDTITDEGTATGHNVENGKCSFCGMGEDYINAPFAINGNLAVAYEESAGNWTKDATLDKDGYEWNENTKTLKLGNIYITGNLILPSDCVLNTIVIEDGAKPIVSGSIMFNKGQGSLTVKGKGTLTANKIANSTVTTDNVLTITGGAEVITNEISWSTDGGIEISDNGKLSVSENISMEKIIMDDTSEFKIGINVGISSYGRLENGLASLEKCIPSGYRMTKNDGIFIIPKYASIVFDEEEWSYEVRDKDGNPVTGMVTLKNNPYRIDTKLAGHSISLDGSINLNFYMELDDSIVSDEKAHMLFILPNGSTSEMYVKEAKKEKIDDGTMCYVFTCKVAPKEISDSISVQIITSDGEGSFYEYSVEEYIDYIFANSDDTETLNLVEAMYMYCYLAKIYFSGSDSMPPLDMVTAADLVDFENKAEGTLPTGITYVGSSLLLESETTVRHYFDVENGTDVSSYGFKKKNGYYYKEISGIPAGELGTPQTTPIGDWSISYSPMSYVYSVLESDSTDENLKNLCQVLYMYQQAAEAYQQTHNN